MIATTSKFSLQGLVFSFFTITATCMAAVPDFHTAAILIAPDGTTRDIELLAATHDVARFRLPGASEESVNLVGKEAAVIHVPEPAEYTAAIELYRARKYPEARLKLAAVKERFRPIEGLEDSVATLAAFYEMECLRKEGDLEGLAAALKKFSKGPLSRDYQNRQLELYVLWDAVRTKSWDRLETLAKERAAIRLPGDQRAQVAWCEGLALEGLGRPAEALVSYQTAITADAGASEEITRQAALRVLAIYQQDPEVTAALATKKDASPSNAGRVKLAQARAIAALFELSLGNGEPLPAPFRQFRKR